MKSTIAVEPGGDVVSAPHSTICAASGSRAAEQRDVALAGDGEGALLVHEQPAALLDQPGEVGAVARAAQLAADRVRDGDALDARVLDAGGLVRGAAQIRNRHGGQAGMQVEPGARVATRRRGMFRGQDDPALHAALGAVGERGLEQPPAQPAALDGLVDRVQREAPDAFTHERQRDACDPVLAVRDPATAGVTGHEVLQPRDRAREAHVGVDVRGRGEQDAGTELRRRRRRPRAASGGSAGPRSACDPVKQDAATRRAPSPKRYPAVRHGRPQATSVALPHEQAPLDAQAQRAHVQLVPAVPHPASPASRLPDVRDVRRP